MGKLSEKMWGRAIKVISSKSELEGDGVMYTLTKALMPRTCDCIELCCNDPSVGDGVGLNMMVFYAALTNQTRYERSIPLVKPGGLVIFGRTGSSCNRKG